MEHTHVHVCMCNGAWLYTVCVCVCVCVLYCWSGHIAKLFYVCVTNNNNKIIIMNFITTISWDDIKWKINSKTLINLLNYIKSTRMLHKLLQVHLYIYMQYMCHYISKPEITTIISLDMCLHKHSKNWSDFVLDNNA